MEGLEDDTKTYTSTTTNSCMSAVEEMHSNGWCPVQRRSVLMARWSWSRATLQCAYVGTEQFLGLLVLGEVHSTCVLFRLTDAGCDT